MKYCLFLECDGTIELCDYELECKGYDVWLRPWPEEFLGFYILTNCCMVLTGRGNKTAIIEQVDSTEISDFLELPFNPTNITRTDKECKGKTKRYHERDNNIIIHEFPDDE